MTGITRLQDPLEVNCDDGFWEVTCMLCAEYSGEEEAVTARPGVLRSLWHRPPATALSVGQALEFCAKSLERALSCQPRDRKTRLKVPGAAAVTRACNPGPWEV